MEESKLKKENSELKEYIVVLKNYCNVLKKKNQIQKDSMVRNQKLILKYQDRIARANNYIDQVIMYKIPKELYNDIEKLQDIINGNNFSGSDKE